MMAVQPPPYRTAEQAWEDFKVAVAPLPAGVEESDFKYVFFAAMTSAMAITYHYGTADLREELRKAMKAVLP